MATSSSDLEERLAKLLTDAGLGYFEREYRFHPVRRWRFDFAYPGHRIAVEVEGATWTQGRHTRGSGFLEDCWKYNASSALGWRIVRLTGTLIKEDGRAVQMIRDAINWKPEDEEQIVARMIAEGEAAKALKKAA